MRSEVSLRSPNVHQELRLAMEFRKPLLPLILEQVEYPDDVRGFDDHLVRTLDGVEIDYFEEADFEPRVLAGAVRVGSTRLIDNVVLEGD